MDFSETASGDGRVLAALIRMILDMSPMERSDLLDRLTESRTAADPDAKREDARTPYSKTVYFDFENYMYTGTIRDISTTGMFIETDASFQPGQMIMVNIPDSTGGGTLRLAGEIVRLDPEGIGVKFVSKSSDA